MNLATKIAIGVGVTVGVVALASVASASTPDGGDDVGNVSNKVRMWRKLEWIDSLTDTQRYFLMLVAYGEGKYNPAAHNGTASERLASSNALDNSPKIRGQAQSCGIDLDKLRSGSWTTFQLLAPYVTGTAFEVFGGGACPFADPTRAPANLNLQIVLAIEHARDLQAYQGFIARPTVGNLRLGWAAPAWMGYEGEHQDRITKYRAHAEHEKFPANLIDSYIGMFPNNPSQIYELLRSSGPP